MKAKFINALMIVALCIVCLFVWENKTTILKIVTQMTSNSISVSSVASNLANIQELCVVRYDYEKVSVIESEKYYFANKKLIVTCRGKIKYGYALTDMTEKDMWIDEKKCLCVRLPDLKILSNEIGPIKVLHNENTIWFNELQPEDVVNAQEAIKQQAISEVNNNNELQKSAKESVKKALEVIVKAMNPTFGVTIVER